jgi:nicotinamide-nucleotide amidase
MNVEIVNTGSELMLGRVLNTHQQWLCRRLSDLGHAVIRQVAVADSGDEIQTAVREALCHADLVITTGGLGPTSDDLTRELIAALLGRKLMPDPAVLAHIDNFFAQRNRLRPARTSVETLVPEGAAVFLNAFGTAPGLAMEIAPNPFRAGPAAWLIMLPGPPRELRPMFDSSVVPYLQQTGAAEVPFVCRTLRTTGVGESRVQEMVETPLQPIVALGLDLGYCARPGAVDVRLAFRGERAEQVVKEAEAVVQKILGAHIYGFDDDELENVVVRLLMEQKKTVAFAESCTGGNISHRLTNVPGASAVFAGGVVSYANSAKEKLLGVRVETLRDHGAVSESVAREMAAGARAQFGSDFALAVTGIAGPGGGSADKPVGTVFIGLASAQGVRVERRLNPWDRLTFKDVTATQALELLRQALLSGTPGI